MAARVRGAREATPVCAARASPVSQVQRRMKPWRRLAAGLPGVRVSTGRPS